MLSSVWVCVLYLPCTHYEKKNRMNWIKSNRKVRTAPNVLIIRCFSLGGIHIYTTFNAVRNVYVCVCAFAIFRHFKAIQFEQCVCECVFVRLLFCACVYECESKRKGKGWEWKNKHQNKANSNRLCVFCAASIWIVCNSYIRCLFIWNFNAFQLKIIQRFFSLLFFCMKNWIIFGFWHIQILLKRVKKEEREKFIVFSILKWKNQSNWSKTGEKWEYSSASSPSYVSLTFHPHDVNIKTSKRF